MLYGVSYYPEHKTKEELSWDLKLLKESGINTVRMGEFAWCRMEPEEGHYDFSWLDPVIEELGQAGIKTIVCTPTACPPAWMVEKYPDVLYQDNRRIRRPFGGRRHSCYNHEAYRELSRRIAEEIGIHYGKNTHVAGFQIDNELAQEGSGRCTCPVCQKKFTLWLKAKYGTIEAFNKRSGAIFWSQEYGDFVQITPPVNAIEPGSQTQIQQFYENPTVRLEFERYSSDCQIEFQNIQADALMAHTNYPVTTNTTGLATNSIDYYKSTKHLSCYAFDYYPSLRDSFVDSFPYAFGRGVKESQPFWVLEFVSGGGHRFGGSGRMQPNPGAMKQAVIQSFAHGADMLLHFQFRSFPIGAEQLNYAIVDLDGIPRRRYFEMQETAALLKKLEPLAEASFESEIAILLNYDSHWALKIKPVNEPQFTYMEFAQKLYRNLEKAGFTPDVVSGDSDFSNYKAVILPASIILTEETAKKLEVFVERGGILLATFLTGVKNEDNIGYTTSLPAGLTKVLGIRVEEVEPVFECSRSRLVVKHDGRQELTEEQIPEERLAMDSSWSELLAGSAGCMGYYTEGYKKDSMVISEHTFGRGRGYYVGTDLPDETWQELFRTIFTPVCEYVHEFFVPDDVEVVSRIWKDRRIYFFFNFSGRCQEIAVPEGSENYLTGERLNGSILLEEQGFIVII